MKFNGSNYSRKQDDSRLTAQYRRIFKLMKDGQFRTLAEIEGATEDPQASISAQLRHMRKARFGAHQVSKFYLGEGLYVYQLVVNKRR